MVEKLAKLTGMLMLIAALIVSVLLISTIFQVLYWPESVAAVKVISDFLSAQFPLIVSDTREKKEFFDIDPSSRLVIVYFVAAFALFALGSVLRVLIDGALSFLKFAKGGEQDNRNKKRLKTRTGTAKLTVPAR